MPSIMMVSVGDAAAAQATQEHQASSSIPKTHEFEVTLKDMEVTRNFENVKDRDQLTEELDVSSKQLMEYLVRLSIVIEVEEDFTRALNGSAQHFRNYSDKLRYLAVWGARLQLRVELSSSAIVRGFARVEELLNRVEVSSEVIDGETFTEPLPRSEYFKTRRASMGGRSA